MHSRLVIFLTFLLFAFSATSFAQHSDAVGTLENAFNPRITAIGNFLGCGTVGRGQKVVGNDHHAHGHDHGHHAHNEFTGLDVCKTGFQIREFELDMRASGAFFDAVLVLGISPAHGLELEEGYFDLRQWPGLGYAPASIRLRLGRYRSPFGRFNHIHLHDLPQITAPRVIQAFFGEHGLIHNGLLADIPLPTPGESNALHLKLGLSSADKSAFHGGYKGAIPSGFGRLSWFFETSDMSDLEVGMSTYMGAADNNVKSAFFHVYGLDVHQRIGLPFQKNLLVGGEFMMGNRQTRLQSRKWPLGGFVYTQLQLDPSWYIGVRYDLAPHSIADADFVHAISPYATYYANEFLRFRVGYEHSVSEFTGWKGHDTVMAEVNFVFGSHPVEPYWVNR